MRYRKRRGYQKRRRGSWSRRKNRRSGSGKIGYYKNRCGRRM